MLQLLILLVTATSIKAHLGSCEDHSTECPKWESWGFCDTNLKFMAQNCPVTCDICLDPGCFNRSPDCDTWEMEGLCSRHNEVQRLCPHSCNLCQIPGEFLSNNTKSIAQPDFECGVPVQGRVKRYSSSVADLILSAVQRSKRHTVSGQPHAHHHHDFAHDHSHDHTHDHTHDHAHDHTHDHTHDHAPVRTSASLQKAPVNFGRDNCSPVLIHERFLLVAAHCVLDPARPVRRVRLGKKNPVNYEILRVILHPSYRLNSFERYDDLALLEMKEAIQFNEEIYPSCLYDKRPPVGTVVTDDYSGAASGNGGDGNLEIVHSLQCELLYETQGMATNFKDRYPNLIQETDLFCANFQSNNACQKRTRGPLFRNDSGRRFLVGFISKDVTCMRNAPNSLPGFYTSISDHIDFINNIIYP